MLRKTSVYNALYNVTEQPERRLCVVSKLSVTIRLLREVVFIGSIIVQIKPSYRLFALWYRSFFLSYYYFLPLSLWYCGGGAWRLLFYRYFCGSLIKD